MGKALYGVYLAGVLGLGGIAVSMLNANQAVTQTVFDCARMSGSEQNRCFAQARSLAEGNAAFAKQLLPEQNRTVQSALNDR